MNFPQRLIDGYGAFASGRLQAEQHRYRELAERGQTPEIMVIGCCDSRVSPEVIFDARPGELFVVRNVANLVPPFETGGTYHGVSAALEFGVGALKVKHIVVLGHAHCGGVRAYAEDAAPISPGDFIGRWMSLMAPAAEKVGPRGSLSRAGISGAAGEGVGRQHARQPDDVPAPAQTDRARRGDAARRLFRRGGGRAFGARPGDGRVQPEAPKLRRSRRYPLPASPAHARAHPAR